MTLSEEARTTLQKEYERTLARVDAISAGLAELDIEATHARNDLERETRKAEALRSDLA